MKIRTIRQTARELDIPENFIRHLVKDGKCPGFYSATRFYVNVEKLVELLENAQEKKERL